MRYALIVFCLFVASSSCAYAVDGTLPTGNGAKAQGMGGVTIGLPQDAHVGAMNPAAMVVVGNRVDLGGDLLFPVQGADVPFGPPGRPPLGSLTLNGAAGKSLYTLPTLGINRMLDDRTSIGLSLWGAGLGASYNEAVGAPTNGVAGDSLIQAIATISLARRVSDTQALGIGLNVGYQQFNLTGVEAQTGLTNPGLDSSTGLGVRLGYLGKFGKVTLGATYSTATKFGKLKKYAAVMANGGDLGVPENFGVGASADIGAFTLGADGVRVVWSGIPAVGNLINFAAPFGAPNGTGFAFQNQWIVRFGAAARVSPGLVLRSGYSNATRLFEPSQTLLLYLAPGAVTQHVTFGFTGALGRTSELTAAWEHGFRNRIVGTGVSTGVNPYQMVDAFHFNYGHKF